MDNLQKIQKILRRATDDLCSNLPLASGFGILRKLIANGTLFSSDKEIIRSQKSQGDEVEKLLEILEKRPESSYIKFREVLKNERKDLYSMLTVLEREFNYTPGNDFSYP